MTVGVVVIGRNEGARLIRCLSSVMGQADFVVYVDSGSSDGSQAAAKELGADVISVDMDLPFTAARARNDGFIHLATKNDEIEYVQFIDGDCALNSDWIALAQKYLDEHPRVAVACGRRRERHPTASIYNRLIDQEWDTPVGEAKSCGGDAMMRVTAFQDVSGFNPELIAGEEPELCVRLRADGWTICRLDAEMTLHDAAISKLSQWWKRNRRAGHAYGEGVAMHGRPPENHGVRETRSALIWGVGIPVTALFGSFLSTWALGLLLAWPAQVIRLGIRDGDFSRAFFLTLGKLPEAQGILGYYFERWRGKRVSLIEYK
ncbi:Glycosyltransferase, GT2 family [Litoreibacter ascidiaceicola]|uniref:Glycosyltransferase, GT2 family n=1 Tax=Litoreibacter ascidiaceicola TaxID=1486859 RepID=A0A1M5DWI0_9RHOB|nr:glycosyltransferase [Litoreibacter ascidiaceicola]SHF71280.1 Glycosyltransferase, GT2 family [Litoreibacter ascidiaceicola]